MTKIHFLQYTHYVIYDYEHDKELGIVTKSGMAFYKELDADAAEKVRLFALAEGEEFKKDFYEKFRIDHDRLFMYVMDLYDPMVELPKEEFEKCFDDCDALYKFYMEREQNHYEKITAHKQYRRH